MIDRQPLDAFASSQQELAIRIGTTALMDTSAALMVVLGRVSSEGRADELRAVASDPLVQAALERDMDRTRSDIIRMGTDSLCQGYVIGGTIQLESAGVRGVVDDTRETCARLVANWPIRGHLLSAHADHLVRTLRFDAQSSLSLPLVGQVDPRLLPDQIGEAAAKHSRRFASLIDTTVYSGAQAATVEIGQIFAGQDDQPVDPGQSGELGAA